VSGVPRASDGAVPARRRVVGALVAGLLTIAPLTGVAAAWAAPAPVTDPVTPMENGRLPDEVLAPAGGVRLAQEAAEAFEAMVAAAAGDGVMIAITDGYRTFDAQVDLKQRKGWLAATPGTSMHGWGLAVDLDLRVTDLAWLQANAADYGWVHPPWARPGGSKPEPWHWEYVGPAGGTPDVTLAPEVTVRPAGTLVALARLEYGNGRIGRWFAIREGLDDLERSPGRYPTSGELGEPGNVAIAGYHRSNRAPLRGMERLGPDDHVRVRTTDGTVRRFRVVERAELGPEDVWAIEPDPRHTGADEVLTLTTSPSPDTFLVVWAEPVE